jgi:hypothetical protein
MGMMRNAKIPKRGCAAGPKPGAFCATLLVTAVLAQGAAAQQLTGFPQELPRYTVELIVFTYAEESTGNEIFVPESPPFDEFIEADGARHPDAPVPVFSDSGQTDRLGEASDPGEPAARPIAPAEGPLDEPRAGGSAGANDRTVEITGIENNLRDIPLRARIELQLLAPEQYTMDEIFERLVALDAYQPVMRTAWTQTTPARNEAPAIRLRALGEPPPGLTGTVTLYQGRFVHLGVDLELDAEGLYAGGGIGSESRSATDRAIAGSRTADTDYDPAGSDSRRPIPVYSDRGYGEGMPGEEGTGFPRPVHYRIDEVRIMRDGDIRYYDHPHFGVIAKLTEIPEAAEKTPPLAGD